MPEVRPTPEYCRVRDLPRRLVRERDAEAWASILTPYYRRPMSTAAFRPWQGFAIAEAVQNNGALLGLPVGQGKTLITHILPTPFNSDRPVLFVPGAALVDKTYSEYAGYSRDWVAPRNPIVVRTLQSIAPESGADYLFQFKPDLVMVDECDDAANLDSAAVQRLDRYKVAARICPAHGVTFPLAGRGCVHCGGPVRSVPYVCLTGTLGRWSIMDYWHHLCWCLTDRAPVPRSEDEAREWAQAINEPRTNRQGWSRMKPGVLGPTKEAAQEWWSDRLTQTPGVVIVDGDSCDQPLTIRIRPAAEDPILDRAFERFLKTLKSPNDEKNACDNLSRYLLDGQIGCGFYTFYDPKPPDEWKIARHALDGFVRQMILNSRRSGRPIDTEKQVISRYPDHPIVTEWQRVKKWFDPDRSSRAVWLTDSVIQTARAWIAERSDPGIVWCGAVEFAEALANATGLSYYGREGRERRTRRGLHDADPRSSMIVSWHANKKGFNLQAWARQALFMPPQSAKYLEQTFGRSHRQGQLKPVVVDIFATSGGTYDLFDTAFSEASFGKRTTTITQKILRAKIEHLYPRETKSNRYRWAVRSERDE